MAILSGIIHDVLGHGKKEEDHKKDDKYGKKEEDHKKDDKYGKKDDHHGKKDDDDKKDDHHGKKDDDDKKDDHHGKKHDHHGKKDDDDKKDDHHGKKHDDGDVIYGTKHSDKLVGSNGDDKIFGDKGHDKLIGKDGDDELYGEEGNDYLSGGNGDDWLVGGKDYDTLEGGKGYDSFKFSGVTKWSNGHDSILDFKPSDDNFFFSLKAVEKATDEDFHWGKVDSEHVVISKKGEAHDEDDFFLYSTDTGVLTFDADGKGGDDAVALATLVGSPDNVTADNFMLT